MPTSYKPLTEQREMFLLGCHALLIPPCLDWEFSAFPNTTALSWKKKKNSLLISFFLNYISPKVPFRCSVLPHFLSFCSEELLICITQLTVQEAITSPSNSLRLEYRAKQWSCESAEKSIQRTQLAGGVFLVLLVTAGDWVHDCTHREKAYLAIKSLCFNLAPSSKRVTTSNQRSNVDSWKNPLPTNFTWNSVLQLSFNHIISLIHPPIWKLKALTHKFSISWEMCALDWLSSPKPPRLPAAAKPRSGGTRADSR